MDEATLSAGMATTTGSPSSEEEGVYVMLPRVGVDEAFCPGLTRYGVESWFAGLLLPKP